MDGRLFLFQFGGSVDQKSTVYATPSRNASPSPQPVRVALSKMFLVSEQASGIPTNFPPTFFANSKPGIKPVREKIDHAAFLSAFEVRRGIARLLSETSYSPPQLPLSSSGAT